MLPISVRRLLTESTERATASEAIVTQTVPAAEPSAYVEPSSHVTTLRRMAEPDEAVDPRSGTLISVGELAGTNS
jgi:hypothetical protein